MFKKSKKPSNPLEIIIIAAISENGFIGKGGHLPWSKLQEDMVQFRKLTMGHPIIMGRKTADSLSSPLEGRQNIIITSDPHYGLDDLKKPSDFIETNYKKNSDEVFYAAFYEKGLDFNIFYEELLNRFFNPGGKNYRPKTKINPDGYDLSKLCVIGGEKTYSLLEPKATKLEITRVKGEYTGDTKFPFNISTDEWKLIKTQGGKDCWFETYERIIWGKEEK